MKQLKSRYFTIWHVIQPETMLYDTTFQLRICYTLSGMVSAAVRKKVVPRSFCRKGIVLEYGNAIQI